MTTFMYELGRRCARHRNRVLAAWLVAAVAVLGLRGAFGGEMSENFRVPGVEAQAANDALAASFPAQAGWSGRVVFHTDDGRLDDPERRSVIEQALALARQGDEVTMVSDPFDTGRPAVSPDGKTAFATINFSSNAPQPEYYRDASAVAELARRGGVEAELSSDIAEPRALEGSEALGLVAAAIVLLVAFGSVFAMGVPIMTALLGLFVGLGGVGILAGITNVSPSAPVLASMIGLGVGVDYALFVVTRFRENLAEGQTPMEAAGHANATAGLSVVFAGMTVVVAICGLAVAGIPAIAAMGFSAAIVVLVAMIVAVTLLPALLGTIGHRIDRLSIHRADVVRRRSSETTFARRWANHVGQRPWTYALASFAVLVALAAPLSSMRLGFADDSNSPTSSTEYRAYQLLVDAFGPGFNGPLAIVVTTSEFGNLQAEVDRVTAGLDRQDGIASVQPPLVNPAGDTAVIIAQPTTGPQDETTQRTLADLRDSLPSLVDDEHTQVLITGRTAAFRDLSDRLSSRLPFFVAAVVVVSFFLLMVLFRSVLVPLKAALMNLLSIGAAYGVVVAMFQWGWGRELVGVDDSVPINPFVPMIMFAILFGLSMDYEVFLLARVRESFTAHGDSHRSVVEGLSSTARVITSAALIMISVFLAFAASSNVMIKMFGVGLATAVLIDATLVRMVLVPSTMALLGRANWWIPRWLDRILPNVDLEGSAAGPTRVSDSWVVNDAIDPQSLESHQGAVELGVKWIESRTCSAAATSHGDPAASATTRARSAASTASAS